MGTHPPSSTILFETLPLPHPPCVLTGSKSGKQRGSGWESPQAGFCLPNFPALTHKQFNQHVHEYSFNSSICNVYPFRVEVFLSLQLGYFALFDMLCFPCSSASLCFGHVCYLGYTDHPPLWPNFLTRPSYTIVLGSYLIYVCACLITAFSIPHVNPITWHSELHPAHALSHGVLAPAHANLQTPQEPHLIPARRSLMQYFDVVK